MRAAGDLGYLAGKSFLAARRKPSGMFFGICSGTARAVRCVRVDGLTDSATYFGRSNRTACVLPLQLLFVICFGTACVLCFKGINDGRVE